MENYKGWGTKNPGHIVYLIDLSESMRWNSFRNIKDVMEVTYKCLDQLIGPCLPGQSVFERFTASIIGYNSKIIHLFPNGGVAEIEKLLDSTYGKALFDYEKEEDPAYPRWQTYMASAFDAAYDDVTEWISRQRQKGYYVPAPYVINITDGHPEESDPTNPKENIPEEVAMKKALTAADRLKSIKTEDGDLLLFNIHYDPGASDELITPVDRPVGNEIFDKRRQFMYDASSVLPNEIVEAIWGMVDDPEEVNTHPFVKNVKHGSRAMISNAKDRTILANFVIFCSLTGMFKKESPMG
jgi:uncharacterized protein YegL